MRPLLIALLFMTAHAHAQCLTEACVARLLGVDADNIEAIVPLSQDERPENTVILQGNVKEGRFKVSEHTLVPAHPPSASPVPVPPPRAGRAASGKAGPRATWIWHAADWLQDGAALLAWARGEKLGQLYITVPTDAHGVRDHAALARFVRQAHRLHIAIWSVDGDPHMALPTEHAAAARLAQAYLDYNRTSPPDARLDGIQFDVEPYLLPDDGSSATELNARYLAMVHTLRKAAGTLKLEFVVPFWWSDRADLLAALARDADSLMVMDYRTDPEQVVEFAAPFLDWAQSNGKSVRIALEAGPIAAETQRRYHPTDGPADLMAVQADGKQILVALRAPAAVPEGVKGYRLGGTRELDGSATTFARDLDKLHALVPVLEKRFSAWPGFAGMAVHGLR